MKPTVVTLPLNRKLIISPSKNAEEINKTNQRIDKLSDDVSSIKENLSNLTDMMQAILSKQIFQTNQRIDKMSEDVSGLKEDVSSMEDMQQILLPKQDKSIPTQDVRSQHFDQSESESKSEQGRSDTDTHVDLIVDVKSVNTIKTGAKPVVISVNVETADDTSALVTATDGPCYQEQMDATHLNVVSKQGLHDIVKTNINDNPPTVDAVSRGVSSSSPGALVKIDVPPTVLVCRDSDEGLITLDLGLDLLNIPAVLTGTHHDSFSAESGESVKNPKISFANTWRVDDGHLFQPHRLVEVAVPDSPSTKQKKGGTGSGGSIDSMLVPHDKPPHKPGGREEEEQYYFANLKPLVSPVSAFVKIAKKQKKVICPVKPTAPTTESKNPIFSAATRSTTRLLKEAKEGGKW
jgi:hypothetical protein